MAATKSAFLEEMLGAKPEDDWTNMGGAKIKAGDPGITYVKPQRVESVLNPKKADPFQQMMQFMMMHRMMQGQPLGMPELMMMGGLPKAAAMQDVTPGTLSELVGKSPDDYAARLLKQLKPEHYRSAGFGTNKQDDVVKNLLENIIPNELMSRHALQVGGGKLPMGQAIIDAYLRENPSHTGLGLKTILKDQLGPHLTGISNQQAAQNLNSGLDGLTQAPKQQAPNADELLQMIQEHIQTTQGAAPMSQPAMPGMGMKMGGYKSAWSHMKVADIKAPVGRPMPPTVQSNSSPWPTRMLLGGAGLAGAGGLAAGLSSDGAADVGENLNHFGTGVKELLSGTGAGLGGMLGGAGAGLLNAASDHPLLAMLGLGAGGLGLWRALRNKGQAPEEIAKLAPNKFLDPAGRFAQLDPATFESVVGQDPSFGRMARGLDPQTIAGLEKHVGQGGFRSFLDRIVGGGGQQDASKQVLQNLAYSTGGGANDPIKHLQTITGLGPKQLGPALSRMLMAARAPQSGGQFTQALGDQTGLGGMKIQPQDPMTQMLMMNMLR